MSPCICEMRMLEPSCPGKEVEKEVRCLFLSKRPRLEEGVDGPSFRSRRARGGGGVLPPCFDAFLTLVSETILFAAFAAELNETKARHAKMRSKLKIKAMAAVAAVDA